MSGPCWLVADVARRCASLNPSLSDQASIQTPGVLLIDEVDMHLHPAGSSSSRPAPGRVPALQIIVTTHSPHVLSTVEKSSIRVLHIEDDEVMIETPLMQTRGVESSGCWNP